MTEDWISDYSVKGKISAGKQAEQEGDAVLLGPNGKIPGRFISGAGFKYSLRFDSAVFATDPTACLTYADDCMGFTPVDNSASTALAGADEASWGNGNPLIEEMFWATISEGNIHHVLDPNDLSKGIDGVDRSQEIQQENVMLIIPTVYTKRNAAGITLSSKASDGTAYAHTYDNHTYKYLAIGQYMGSEVGGKLMSVSGATPAKNKTRAAFRAEAQANGEGWMLTNWHTRQLIRDLTLLTIKSFDSQRKVGQGHSTGGSGSNPEALTTGLTNALGRYAGNAQGTTDQVKMLIESPWADKWEFADDVLTGYNETDEAWADIYVGQQLQVQDDLTKMVLMDELETANMHASTNAFCTAIHTDEVGWGLWNNHDGTDATGLCDRHWSNPSAQRLCFCGGDSNSGSGCGVSALCLNDALSHAGWVIGARPAFVFD